MKPFTNADFQEAKAKHLQFKSRLRAILYDQLPEQESKTVLSQYACAVGQWIYGHALIEYETIPEVHELEQVHASLHVVARELVNRHQQGQVEEARQGLVGMEQIADRLVELLHIVEEKVITESPNTVVSDEDSKDSILSALLAKNELLDAKIQQKLATQQQSKILESERQVLHDFFMQAPAAHCILRGSKHIFELTNPPYQELVGGRDVLGKTVREALPELEGQGFYELLDTVLTTGEPLVGNELPIFLDNGRGQTKNAYLNFIYQPIKNRQGQAEGILVFAYEVTEQVLARQLIQESEERYRTLSTKLEQQVQERTEELEAINEELAASNEELTQSNQLLVRSNDNLEKFAYIASHDLQEPLRKIQQFGDLLKSRYTPISAGDLDYLARMQSAASRMSTLIRDLLNFSRIATRRDTSAAISLNTVVSRVLLDLDLRIAETGAVVEVGELPTLPGDATQLGQLFQNLLNNALKFHRPDEPPHIQIQAQLIQEANLPTRSISLRQAKQYHRIDVMDNGIGFDEKYLDRIFQVFQRLHGKNEFAGTGIGLAICEKVVLNHGGIITAKSQPGQGATFQIYLPVVLS